MRVPHSPSQCEAICLYDHESRYAEAAVIELVARCQRKRGHSGRHVTVVPCGTLKELSWEGEPQGGDV